MHSARITPALLVLPLLALGCGSSPKGTDPNPPGKTISSHSQAIDGSWQWSVDAALAPSSSLARLSGTLRSTSEGVVGRLTPVAVSPMSSCADPLAVLPAEGVLDATGVLTLTLPLAGGTATLTAPLPDSAHVATRGSWQIVGGSCATGATPLRLEKIANPALLTVAAQ